MATLSNTITPSNVLTATNTQTVSNKTFVAPILGTPASGNFSTGTFTWPTFNQNTTGSAATATTATNVSGGTVSATSIAYSTTLTGGTGIINIGSGQIYKDESGKVGIGTSSPIRQFSVGTPNGGANSVINIGSGTSAIGTLEFGDGTTGDDRFRGYVQYSHVDNSLRLGTDAIERMRIASTGSVVVSSSATYNAAPAVSTVFHVMSETAGDTINHVNYSGSSTAGSGYGMRTARGTAAAPAAVQVGDRTGAIFMGGYTGSAFVNTAVIQSNIDTGTVSASSLPTYMSFLTTPNNSIGRLERVRITSEGSVGVGTTTPGYSGGANRRYISIVGNGDSGILQLSNSVAATGNNGNIEWIDVGNTSSTTLRNAYITSGSSGATANNRGSFIALATKDDGVAGAGTERLRIDAVGNIGMGTSSADQRLTINSANTTTNSLLSIKQGDVTQAYVGMGTDNVLRLMSLARPAGITVGGANYIFFNVNGSERARIDASGNVGIGIDAPTAKLHVAGQTVISYNIATPANYYNGLQQEIRATSGTAGIGFHREGFSHCGIYHDATDTLKFNMNGGTVTLNASVGTIIGSGNYTSYALPLTGGSLSGVLTINSTNDNQLLLQSSDSWTGIGFNDSAVLGTDFIWHNGTNGTFAIGGSGANVANKKLHVDGGMTIGANYDSTTNPTNGLNVEGAIQQAGNQVLHAGNYTSYSPTLTGGSASGTWGINVTGSSASCTGNAATASNINTTQPNIGLSISGQNIDYAGHGGPQVQSQGSGAAMMSFHRPGAYAINFGLGTDNQLRTGGWSRGGNYVVLDSGNYTSYAPARVSAARPGVTKLYRSDDDSGYNIQTHWSPDVSGYWSLRGYLNDSYHAACYVALSGKSNRANGFFYIDDNFGVGVVGNYNASRYQTVYAMGDAYKMAADGASLANMYGIGWSHPNAGGAAGNLTDHGMLIINNGGFRCAISNSIVASGNITAYSDERLKTNWRDMPVNYVARLAQVKVGVYDRIDGENGTQVGVSAQSLQELLPQAIMTAKDEMQTLSVSYGSAALASAVELAKDNVELRARIMRLESLIEQLLSKE
jgi:hypothetical protein